MRLVLLALLLGACVAPGEGVPSRTFTVGVNPASPSVSSIPSAPTGTSALAWRRIPDIPTGRSEVAATV
ncbi:MAG TPA: hypothetical protein VFQ66_08140, partial [Candidatus Limnocylindria bacterium]|nr:hypothetical protein [Candidatus Limnocylindria bacterium]